MIDFVVIANEQKSLRLLRWYAHFAEDRRLGPVDEAVSLALADPEPEGVIDWRYGRLVYRRYAALTFIFAIDAEENELLVYEMLHAFADCLDGYFEDASELDLIFNSQHANYLLDEIVIGGHVYETSRNAIIKAARAQDQLELAEGHA
ncbi:Sigma adaptin [Giardia muris]|uniref:AP complex subunit sigma n=1 Tax=Giardia muris TaxID=5742 RepID=A0A4Z1SWK4_GIAMU|nr:Sigma adaptin [Giardia muris]|eukprot:TNJ30116.1 Sigma adaptin [Giardia muris]